MDEPLAVLVACACDEGFLEELEQLIERCGGSTASVRRRFGSCEGGHPPRQFGNKATYLQSSAVATPSREGGSLADALWRRTQSADVWGVTTKAAQRSRGRPALRVLELLEYDVGAGALGFHDDGETLVTGSLMLSNSGDFSGGEVRFRRVDPGRGGDRHCCISHRRGDICAWRGWERHRVSPITHGVRRVLVAEWWAGPDAPAPTRRAGDSEMRLSAALELDPRALSLYLNIAQRRCDANDLQGALRLLTAALAVDPCDATARRNRAVVLSKQGAYARAELDLVACVEESGAAEDYALLGALQARIGRVDAAQRSFASAKRLRRKHKTTTTSRDADDTDADSDDDDDDADSDGDDANDTQPQP